MSASGMTEQRNTKARLDDQLTATVYSHTVPDATELPRDQTSGAILPYVVLKFAGPIPTKRGRGIAQGEDKQPQVMAAQALCYAYDSDDLDELVDSVVGALLGWTPSDNATAYSSAGGYAFSTASPTNKPTRLEQAISFQCMLNQSIL